MATIDTHKAYRELIDSGISEKQADAIIRVVGDQGNSLVTKSDLDAGLSKLRSEMVVWQVGIALALFGALKFIH